MSISIAFYLGGVVATLTAVLWLGQERALSLRSQGAALIGVAAWPVAMLWVWWQLLRGVAHDER